MTQSILLKLPRFTVTQIQYNVPLGVSGSNAIMMIGELMEEQRQKAKRVGEREGSRYRRRKKTNFC